MGVYKMVVEIPKGWGGYFSGQKMEIPGRRGDLTWNSLRGGGMDIFWNYTLQENALLGDLSSKNTPGPL